MSTHLNTSEFPPTLSKRLQCGDMNAVWKRMAWKESRELLPIAALVLAIAGLCFYVTCLTSKGNYFSASALRTCLYVFITIQAATLAITGFATETEHRTIGMLQSLPVHPRMIGSIKLTVGLVIAIVCVFLIRVLFAGVLSATGMSFTRGDGVLPMLILVPTAVAVYLFSSFVSVNTGSLPRALFCVAVVCAPMLVAVQVNESAVNLFLENQLWMPVLLMLLFGLVMAGLAYQSIVAWVEGKSRLKKIVALVPNFRSAPMIEHSHYNAAINEVNKRIAEESSGPAKFWPVYGRVVWQTWRQSRVALAISALLCLVFVGLVFYSFFDVRSFSQSYVYSGFPWGASTRFTLTLVFCSAVIAVASSSLFWPDHKDKNIRFFQQQREHANAYWCGKLTPWLAMTVVVAMLIYTLAALYLYNLPVNQQPRTFEMVFQSLALLPLFALIVALGCGQLSSILIRNPIISMVAALASSALAAGGMIYLTAMRESLLWYALPVIALLFAASWWRCKDWVGSRNRWLHFAKPIFLLLLGTSVVMGFMINHRATEIAETSSSYKFLMEQGRFKVLQPQGQQETADMYRAAIKLLSAEITGYEDIRNTKADKTTAAFAKKYEAAIDLIIEAAKRPWCSSIFDGEQIARDSTLSPKEKKGRFATQTQDLWKLRYAIACQAVNTMKNGQHDEALEAILAADRLNQRGGGNDVNEGMIHLMKRLIEWAEMPGQSPERIRNAIAELDGPPVESFPQEGAQEPSSTYVNHLYRYRRMEGQLFHIERQMQLGAADVFSGLPWWDEQRRRRISDAIDLEVLKAAMRAAPVDNEQKYLQPTFSKRLSALMRDPIAFRYQRMEVHHPFFLYSLKRQQNTMRYTMVRIALAAWHLEHGKYPQRLDQLSGYFNNGLPRTFMEGRNFGWFPDGLGVTLLHDDNIRYGDPTAPILLPSAAEEMADLGAVEFFDPTTKEFLKQETATTIKGINLSREMDFWDSRLLRGTELKHKENPKK